MKHYFWNEIKYLDGQNKPISYFELNVRHSKGSQTIKDPIAQVDFYKNMIMSQLVPSIGERVDKDKRSYGLIKTSVYFHNEKYYDIIDFYKKSNKNILPYTLIGKDSLVKENLHTFFPESKRNNSNYWNRNLNENLLFWFKTTIPLD